MAIKILATADLHLGKSSSGIPEHSEVASTRYTWLRMINWAITNNVDVVVLCGDIIDRDNRFFEAIGPLQSGFDLLKKAGIVIYLVTGNHDFDVLSQVIHTAKNEHVHLLGINGKWEIMTFSKDTQTIQFVGWSFPNQYVAQDPLVTFAEITLDPNQIAIGLLHGDLDNVESIYAPLQLASLLRSRVNAWILGHIHKPAEIRPLNPSVWYAGSPQALSSKEQGIHGPLLITIKDTDITIHPVALSPVRYERLSIDLTGVDTEADLRDRLITGIFGDAGTKNQELSEVAYLVYDISMVGKSTKIRELAFWAHQLVRDYSQQTDSGTAIVVRSVSSNLQPSVKNLQELSAQESPAGILAQSILALELNQTNPFLEKLLIEWKHKQQLLNTSIVYQPLHVPGKAVDENEPDAKKYILQECNRLLAELMAQQSITE